MQAGSGWREQTRLSTFHSHPTGKTAAEGARWHYAQEKNPLNVTLTPAVFPPGSNAASLSNSRTYHYVRRVTCSNPCVTLPWTILVSSAAPKKNACRAAFRLCDRKKTTTIQLLWPRITERENLVVSYCKLQIILHSAAAHTSLYSLWMQGKLVSAPPKTAHSCAGSMSGSVPVLSIPKQPAKRIQPEPRRQNFFFFGVLFLIDWSFLICSLQIYLQPGLVKLFLYSPEDYSLEAFFFFF